MTVVRVSSYRFIKLIGFTRKIKLRKGDLVPLVTEFKGAESTAGSRGQLSESQGPGCRSYREDQYLGTKAKASVKPNTEAEAA
jgi:hypothetical protein